VSGAGNRWVVVEDGVGLALDSQQGERVIVRVDRDRALLARIAAAGPWRFRLPDRVVVSRGGVLLRRLVAGVTDLRVAVRQADPLDCRRASLDVVSRAEVALDTHRRRRRGELPVVPQPRRRA